MSENMNWSSKRKDEKEPLLAGNTSLNINEDIHDQSLAHREDEILRESTINHMDP